jgi:enoyl-[acyl-carrier protein] reductase III
MRFKGKLALVTGSSRGIGRAIALKLAEEGADVIINYFRNRQMAEKTAAEAEAKGVTARIIKAHVGDAEKLNNMFETIATDYGKLDIFISNAASGVARTAMQLDSQAWDWTMDINAKAFLLGAQQAAKLMEGRGGKMVAISSLGSIFAWPSYTVVGVSKAALEALTRYLAVELASKDISVNAIAAGAVQTEALQYYTKEQLAGDPRLRMNLVGRMITVEDVANVVAFLCSEDAFMIRGQTIVVDGGLSVAGPFQ